MCRRFDCCISIVTPSEWARNTPGFVRFPEGLLVLIFSWEDIAAESIKCHSWDHNTMTQVGFEPRPFDSEFNLLA